MYTGAAGAVTANTAPSFNRTAVTSPGGTTIAAIRVLEEERVRAAFDLSETPVGPWCRVDGHLFVQPERWNAPDRADVRVPDLRPGETAHVLARRGDVAELDVPLAVDLHEFDVEAQQFVVRGKLQRDLGGACRAQIESFRRALAAGGPLLATTSRPIADISAALGYRAPSHFTRFFVRHARMPPTANSGLRRPSTRSPAPPTSSRRSPSGPRTRAGRRRGDGRGFRG